MKGVLGLLIGSLGDHGVLQLRGFPLLSGVQPAHAPAPVEYPLVRRYKAVAFERRGDYDAVGGVSVEIGESGGPDSNLPVDGYLVQAVFENGTPPGRWIARQFEPAFLVEHSDFPE